MRKKILFSVLFCIYTLSWGFCDSWYVCLGSFKRKHNAQKLAQTLKSENIPTYISEYKNGTEVFYRVLLNKPFSFIADARQQRDEMKESLIVNKINASGFKIYPSEFWVCAASSENVSEANGLEDKAAVLTTNETADIPISPEKPYSVKVRSYKEETSAVNDKDRLVKNDIDAYVLKTYDDSSYFSFDVHAGAFEAEDEAAPLQEKLDSLGITDTEVSNYEDIAENIEKYNEVIKTQDVTYEDGNYTIPTSFSDWVKKCIQQFPINKNFQIEEITIFDLDNIAESNLKSVVSGTVNDYLANMKNVHAASFARYKDDLFNKKVSVFIAAGDDESFAVRKLQNSTEMQLAVVDDVLDCVAAPDDGDYVLYGINKAKNLNIIMRGEDFTDEQFTEFVNNVSSDSSLLAYPQLRKTLLVLPEKNDSLKRDFLYFNLSRIDRSYAAERGYADWAIPIVGHWKAGSSFCQNNEVFDVAFFEMDYDYNAKKIHDMFMREKKGIYIDERNHPSNVEGLDSWYISNIRTNELSFSTKSYIIAIDSSGSNSFNEDDFINISRELQIWK